MSDDVERLTAEEWDIVCDALIDYAAKRVVPAPERAEHWVRPRIERILAAHVVAARAEAYDDGYNDAVTMARCYGHTDHWPEEDEPRNPYLLPENREAIP